MGLQACSTACFSGDITFTDDYIQIDDKGNALFKTALDVTNKEDADYGDIDKYIPTRTKKKNTLFISADLIL